jgi:nicotinamide mononucleotide transporter
VPKRVLLLLSLVALAVFLLIAFILIRFTDSNVPWLDSFTTALSIVGMWMLARKYVEQWWVWIVVDLVSAGLYIYKDLHFTAVLYFVYAIIAIFGYRKWKGMME